MTLSDPRLPDNPIVYANQAFIALTGYERAEIIGRNCRFLQGPQTDPATVSDIRDAILNGREVETEILNYRKDGQSFWNALCLSPIRDGEGAVRYYFSSQTDVTPHRETLEALLRAQKTLAIGQMASGMAHDFNNLLTIIIGNVELAAQCAGDPSMLAEYIGRVRDATSRGSRMIQHLLAFARQQPTTPVLADINKVVHEFVGIVGDTLGHTISIKTDLKAEPALIEIDTTQLELAILNALMNARDAIDGQGTVTIATSNMQVEDGNPEHQGMRPGPHVVLAIADTGSGMPPEIVARVTERYFTTKENGKGSGLGLSQIYDFVTQSNGCLKIDTCEGAGTTIRMIFRNAPSP